MSVPLFNFFCTLAEFFESTCEDALRVRFVSWLPPLFSRLLSASPPVSLPLISRSCPVVRHLSFALSSPAPSRCFILIAPSACPLPPFSFFLLPFFSSPPNSNFGEEQLSTAELSRTENRAKRFSCYVTRLVIYLHVIASVAPESIHFIFIFVSMITSLN